MARRKTQTPTDQQFEVATMWLHSNEGDEAESEACRTVAAWIDRYRNDAMMRNVAREGGVSVAELRRRLAGEQPAATDEEEN